MIAITGATGQLGRLVIENLLSRTQAANIKALVRDPDKAHELIETGVALRRADYDQADSLTEALVGVDKLLLISGNDVGRRIPQHQAVINAARAARVELFAYTSILKADTSPLGMAEEHQATEQAIAASGLPAVILRNGWYTENYTQNLGAVLQTGKVTGAAGQGMLYTASRKDYAEAAANVLTSTMNQVGKVYELAGNEGFNLTQYAAEISQQSGKPVLYQDLSGDEFSKLLVEVGLPESFAALLADAEVHAASGWLAEDSVTLGKLIGRATTSMADSVSEALKSKT